MLSNSNNTVLYQYLASSKLVGRATIRAIEGASDDAASSYTTALSRVIRGPEDNCRVARAGVRGLCREVGSFQEAAMHVEPHHTPEQVEQLVNRRRERDCKESCDRTPIETRTHSLFCYYPYL